MSISTRWVHCPKCEEEWTVDWTCTAPSLFKCHECATVAKYGRSPCRLDDENIYGLDSIRQSIEEDRR